MTGPQHYTKGDEAMEEAAEADIHGDREAASYWLAMAQAHYTAALVALFSPHTGAWREVLT